MVYIWIISINCVDNGESEYNNLIIDVNLRCN